MERTDDLVPGLDPAPARLGLASTAELLLELQARGEVTCMVSSSQELAIEGHDMSSAMAWFLENLSPHLLAYRTVDGD